MSRRLLAISAALAALTLGTAAPALAEGNLGHQFSVFARPTALGHGQDASEIAHLCGPEVLAATVAVDVRRSDKPNVTRLYMVHRPAGYFVWAIR